VQVVVLLRLYVQAWSLQAAWPNLSFQVIHEWNVSLLFELMDLLLIGTVINVPAALQ
jgi:hypothetical protein